MSQPEPQTLSIRRYPNRRLYDVTRSKPVTLDELHRLILEGHRIEVTDTATGEDITAKILAQIILDLDSTKLAAFPVALLHRVIQSNEEIMREFLDAHFHQALDLFVQTRDQLEQQFRKSMGIAGAFSTPLEWSRQWWNHFAPQPSPAAPAPDHQDLRHSIEDLRRQVADLRRQVDQAKAQPI